VPVATVAYISDVFSAMTPNVRDRLTRRKTASDGGPRCQIGRLVETGRRCGEDHAGAVGQLVGHEGRDLREQLTAGEAAVETGVGAVRSGHHGPGRLFFDDVHHAAADFRSTGTTAGPSRPPAGRASSPAQEATNLRLALARTKEVSLDHTCNCNRKIRASLRWRYALSCRRPRWPSSRFQSTESAAAVWTSSKKIDRAVCGRCERHNAGLYRSLTAPFSSSRRSRPSCPTSWPTAPAWSSPQRRTGLYKIDPI